MIGNIIIMSKYFIILPPFYRRSKNVIDFNKETLFTEEYLWMIGWNSCDKKTARGGMFSYQQVIIFVRNIFFEVGRMFASLEESRSE